MDAVGDVSEIGLCVKSAQLGGFNDRYSADECLRSGVSPSKESILSVDADWAQSAFRWIIIDGHTTIGQEQTEDLRAALLMAWMPPPDGIAMCHYDEC
jgi:hypothetical protein